MRAATLDMSCGREIGEDSCSTLDADVRARGGLTMGLISPRTRLSSRLPREVFASTGAERRWLREHRSAAKTQPGAGIGGRAPPSKKDKRAGRRRPGLRARSDHAH